MQNKFRFYAKRFANLYYHVDPKVKGNDAIPDIGPKNLRPPAMM